MTNLWKPILLILSLLDISTAGGQDSTLQMPKVIGLTFDAQEMDSLRSNLQALTNDYTAIRAIDLPNGLPPALYFDPLPPGFTPQVDQFIIDWEISDTVAKPENDHQLAFYSIGQLASLIKHQRVTAEYLTKFFIRRLKAHGETLQCVITITEQLALKQARRADEEIASGNYRGPLHGIPYGAKDLFAVPNYPTTWGAMPYKDQRLDEKATVVKKLEEAGAILVAKLSLGALAWGDVWYDGKTLNPWDLHQGSSGSSAGSASATAAGLVPFALGSETWGSIVSPSDRCGVTGLRPTFGRVSRSGAMTLSWSMDKVGPICRSAIDCAIVFDAIRGIDPKDKTTIKAAFNFDGDVKGLKVAYFEDLITESSYQTQDRETLKIIEKLGINLHPITFDIDLPIEHLGFVLNSEAAAAFDKLTRSNQDDLMVRQIRQAWPNVLRSARFITAVEYLQANRIRTLLIEQMHSLLQDYDAVLTPTFAGQQLLATNLSGHPVVVLPTSFEDGKPASSICLLSNYFEEAKILAVAKAFQEATDFNNHKPPGF